MKKSEGSITLFSLYFFCSFLLWFTFAIDIHMKVARTQENIASIKLRLETENAVFNMVRTGIKKGLYFKRAKFKVEENILRIYHQGNSPSITEYDIIEDGSFEWRNNYDSIK